MGPVLSLGRSEYSVVWLPAKPSVDAATPSPGDRENDPASSPDSKEAVPGVPDPRATARFLMAFCIGVMVTLAWQSYSDAAKQMVVSSSLQSSELAPVAHTSPDVIAPAAFAVRFPDLQDFPRQNADQLTSQQRVNLSFVQLASAQEPIIRNIPEPQRTERHMVSKMPVPLPRPAPAETRKHASRPATTMAGSGPNTHHAVTPSANVASSSPVPILLTHLDTGHKRIRSSTTDLRSPAPDPFSQNLVSAGQSLLSALSRITGILL